ncbi:hypothetical protein GGF46_004534 [Coemansia sp. RSA 552]|nr:hypothetical protein GGF46_004534 [Coemansia sp. RSA 552]
MSPVLGNVWARWAQKRPLLTISLTNGAMGGIGDALAQSAAAAQPDGALQYNPLRTLRFFAYGCMFGPVAYKWYSALDRRLPLPRTTLKRAAGTASTSAGRLWAIGKRVAVDQAVFAPAAVGAFFVVMGAMERKPFPEIRASLCEKYPGTLAWNYALWPWAQLVNFSVIPLIYRVPFSALVGIIWNMCLSWVNSRAPSADRPQPEDTRHTSAP